MNRALLRTGVLTPPAVLAAFLAAPADAHADGGPAAAPAVSVVSVVSALPIEPAAAAASSVVSSAPASSPVPASSGMPAHSVAPVLIGPAPGTFVDGLPGPHGVIPERSLS